MKPVVRPVAAADFEQWAARRAGCSRVYWQAHETNAVAQVLYNEVADRSGFIVYRRQL